MNRRFAVLVLVSILVTAVAVPALAQDKQVSPTFDRTASVRALAKARLALLTARSAKSESRRAARTAQAALNAVKDATGPTGPTGPPGPPGPTGPAAAAIQSALAAGSATTESETFEQLSGGPSLTVTVPPSGLIEVWAQATLDADGAVSLYEDGQQMPGQNESELCTTPAAGGALFAGFLGGPEPTTTVGTPSSMFCGSQGAPGSVLFETTPGPHTYELRYSIGCGCEPEATFSQRLLRIAPRP